MLYNIILLYQNGCLQCDYVKQVLAKKGILKLIKLIEKDTEEFNILCNLYNISKTPTVLVFDNNKQLLFNKVLNSKEDIQWLVKLFWS